MEFILFIVVVCIALVLYLSFNKNKVDEIISITESVNLNKTNTSTREKKDYNFISIKKRHLKEEKNKKDHTEAVWNRMGYSIRHGERYSYIMYGKKVYTHNQVTKTLNSEIRRSSDFEDDEDRQWHREMSDIIGHDQSWK